MQQQPIAVMPIPQQMPVVVPQQPLITAEAVKVIPTPEAQKQFLGEHLFPRVQAADPARAGRIVGMILDAYNIEQIIQNLNDPNALKVTIQRAVETIMEHEMKSGSAPADQ